jgi:hypothetical protein
MKPPVSFPLLSNHISREVNKVFFCENRRFVVFLHCNTFAALHLNSVKLAGYLKGLWRHARNSGFGDPKSKKSLTAGAGPELGGGATFKTGK